MTTPKTSPLGNFTVTVSGTSLQVAALALSPGTPFSSAPAISPAAAPLPAAAFIPAAPMPYITPVPFKVTVGGEKFQALWQEMMTGLGEIFKEPASIGVFYIDEIELALGIDAEGKMTLLGIGGSIEVSGGIKVKLKRNIRRSSKKT